MITWDITILRLRKSETRMLVMLSTKKSTAGGLHYILLLSIYALRLATCCPCLFRMNSEKGFSQNINPCLENPSCANFSCFPFAVCLRVGRRAFFVSNQYNELTDDVIKEKLNSVETEVKSKLGEYEHINHFREWKLHAGNSDRSLQRYSFTDINMYDKEGYLLSGLSTKSLEWSR